jgi:GNAT superfamily N-acetyltransferase
MPRQELKLTADEFSRLPRNAAYKYTYFEGSAWLNPRPRFYHARLDLANLALDGVASLPMRHLVPADWDLLVPVFAEAFTEYLPFAGLTTEERADASRVSLERTQTGWDGPWLAEASFVATTPAGELLGAALVTLLAREHLADWGAVVRPATDVLDFGRPHLTWIFVRPLVAGRGVGTALLKRSAEALAGLGFDELFSTFLAGNDSSMLWHWRAGFRLLSHPTSRRRHPQIAD